MSLLVNCYKKVKGKGLGGERLTAIQLMPPRIAERHPEEITTRHIGNPKF